ncbi:segregation and condensation protein B [Geobacter sp. OR-1]|uniref:SMC-Scp complex subunit ScpB n=1 Tax=Geobacter sp. OR-1 TaxID=1266765 RepID=UPI0005426F3F|nr:SMC-Scp complex subunit ScpB [Geobacter sp. OR-1]GAM10817.1 segregation and condensation protein B [Geobacter sp. OR-1]
MSSLECKALVEGLLFVADGPLSMDRLVSILPERDRQEILAAIEALRLDCERNARGITLAEVAGGYQLRTRPEHAEVMRRLQKSRPLKFSQSALESLAIIAYRQPVTRAEIEYLRGVDCGGVVKTLLEKKLIRILGKKDVPGRPIVYGTTREFLETFNLKNLNALPTLKEIQDLAELPVYEEQGELPLDPSLSVPFIQPLLQGEPES